MRPNPAPQQATQIPYPMVVRNGMVVGGQDQHVFAQRHQPQNDYDFTQRTFRRYVNVGAHNVQLPSGFENRKWLGIRYPYRGAGWLWGFATPIVPSQTRSMSGPYGGGLVPKPASSQQLQNIIRNTVGTMPINPAGSGAPGQFYGDLYDMPGTG